MEIYQHFFERGLTTSHRHFSSAWLNRAENYLCVRSGRGPSAPALINLFRRLWEGRRYLLAARVAVAILRGGDTR